MAASLKLWRQIEDRQLMHIFTWRTFLWKIIMIWFGTMEPVYDYVSVKEHLIFLTMTKLLDFSAPTCNFSSLQFAERRNDKRIRFHVKISELLLRKWQKRLWDIFLLHPIVSWFASCYSVHVVQSFFVYPCRQLSIVEFRLFSVRRHIPSVYMLSSVHLSVCRLSVRPSHGWISQKWLTKVTTND